MTPDEDHRSYVLRVLMATGLTQTQLAHRAGLDPSTLSRFLTEQRDGHILRPSTLRKIAKATGIQAAGEIAAPSLTGLAEAEAAPLAIARHSPLESIIAVLASGGANVDPWTLNCGALNNAGYRAGDILLVSLGEPPVSGDIVCAQIYEAAKGHAETVFRIYQPPYLVASSSEPKFLRPYLVEDGQVAIMGTVIHTIRPRGAQKL